MSYYKTLAISPNASEAEIKSAYKRLAQKYHPDKNKHSEEIMKDINIAYAQLSDLEKKAAYDESISDNPHMIDIPSAGMGIDANQLEISPKGIRYQDKFLTSLDCIFIDVINVSNMLETKETKYTITLMQDIREINITFQSKGAKNDQLFQQILSLIVQYFSHAITSHIIQSIEKTGEYRIKNIVLTHKGIEIYNPPTIFQLSPPALYFISYKNLAIQIKNGMIILGDLKDTSQQIELDIKYAPNGFLLKSLCEKFQTYPFQKPPLRIEPGFLDKLKNYFKTFA